MADDSGNGAGRRGRGAGRPAPRGGRDAVVARVLDAAEELFSERPYADVSVRAVAAAAGVSHALVHRYVGAKSDILRAVLARHEGVLADAAASASTLREAVALMLSGDMRVTERYFRLVLRVAMDSVLREVADVSFPATRLLARLATERGTGKAAGVDPRILVAGVVSLVVGFAGLRRDLVREVGVEDLPDPELDARLTALVDLLLRAAEKETTPAP